MGVNSHLLATTLAFLVGCVGSWDGDLIVHDGQVVRGPGWCPRSVHGDFIVTGLGGVPASLNCIRHIDGALRIDGASTDSVVLAQLRTVGSHVAVVSPELVELSLPNLRSVPSVTIDWAPRLRRLVLSDMDENSALYLDAPLTSLDVGSLETAGVIQLLETGLPDLGESFASLRSAESLSVVEPFTDLAGVGLSEQAHIGQLWVYGSAVSTLSGLGCPWSDDLVLQSVSVTDVPACMLDSPLVTFIDLQHVESVSYADGELWLVDMPRLSQVHYSGPSLWLMNVGLTNLEVEQDEPVFVSMRSTAARTVRIDAPGVLNMVNTIADSVDVKCGGDVSISGGTFHSLNVASPGAVQLSSASELQTLDLSFADTSSLVLSDLNMTELPILPSKMASLEVWNTQLRDLRGVEGIEVASHVTFHSMPALLDASSLAEIGWVGGDLNLVAAPLLDREAVLAMRPMLEERVAGSINLEP
ncbi:MAG: hypothetical protein ACI9MC_001515 [Kiritimatiellia bacterium]|jgi:hypothetical protein